MIRDDGPRQGTSAQALYSNYGNAPLISLINADCRRVLDIGCGAGDNAALIAASYPGCSVFGITNSEVEREIAAARMERCCLFDIEKGVPAEISSKRFDTLLFSHVLEHMRDPAGVLSTYTELLEPDGVALIAVPNILIWRQRIEFLRGRFEYDVAGLMDETHLRFFTYQTADRYLLAKSPHLALAHKTASGSFPLWVLRRGLLPSRWADSIDEWATARWPNLFGWQVLLKARRISTS